MLKYFIATGIYFFIITLFPNQHVIRISGIILILFLIFAKILYKINLKKI